MVKVGFPNQAAQTAFAPALRAIANGPPRPSGFGATA